MISRHSYAYKRPPIAVSFRMQKTVLLVDRDEDSRVVYETMLGHAGYQVILAVDGEEGLALAQLRRPDVLVTELSIAKCPGMDLIRLVLSDPSLAGMRVVVLTASGLEHDRVEALRLGCSLFLSKPIEPKQLLDAIDRLTGPAQRLL